MLCGKQPFEGDNDEEIYDKIRKCNINFLDEEWDIISNDAKDLIKKLLIKDPNKRYSAKEALAHPWIIKNKNIVKIDNDKFAEIVKNLRNYSARLKLQQKKDKIIHENNLSVIQMIQDDLDKLEKENELLNNEVEQIKQEEKDLIERFDQIIKKYSRQPK